MAADLVVVPPEVFVATARDYIAGAISAAAEQGNQVSLALSGGRGPRPVFHQLARVSGLPWEQVAIYFADERAVAPEHPDSNYRLVKESLLDRLPVEVAAVHRMQAERLDLPRSAEEYELVLPARLDVLVLGLGEDGHTASLFPHHPAVAEERRRVLAVEGPNPPRVRLTITPPVIRAARSILMLAAGENKAGAVARARVGAPDPMACPASLARSGVWIIDEPAARQLPPGAL